AKLAEWLALKGKTLKRPAMTSTAPSTKNKTSNKSAAPPSKSQLTTKSNSEPEVKEEPKPVSVTPVLPEDNPEVDNLEVDNPDKRTSLIMNTTLDLLENSDLDLPVDPQDGGSDEIVVNLCDALEALAPPSHCDDVVNKCNDMDNEAKTECVQEEVKMETPNKMMVKSEGSESDEESEESDDDDCYVKENTPPKEEASVVKYSVKTTPFLQ
ncbi:hypothetical protein NL108_014909, partial [Boleophthalmus pectinirostris]